MLVQVDIPEKEYNILKQKAKEDMRSLRNYITIHLKKLANNQLQITDTTAVADNAVIKTQVQRPKTPEEIEEEQIKSFQKLAKIILGHEIENIAETSLDPTMTYYEFAEAQEGRFIRYAYTMPEQKQKEYLEEWKKYE